MSGEQWIGDLMVVDAPPWGLEAEAEEPEPNRLCPGGESQRQRSAASSSGRDLDSSLSSVRARPCIDRLWHGTRIESAFEHRRPVEPERPYMPRESEFVCAEDAQIAIALSRCDSPAFEVNCDNAVANRPQGPILHGLVFEEVSHEGGAGWL